MLYSSPSEANFRLLDPAREDAATRHVDVADWDRPAGSPALEASASAPIAPDSSGVRGRLVFDDRLHDLSGYTGALQSVPARRVGLELRAAVDDSLLVSGWTDDDGRFALRLASGPIDARLVLRARTVTDASDTLAVVTAAATVQRADLGAMPPLAAGTEIDLGTVTAADAPSLPAARFAHLLDLARSAVEWVRRDQGPWPGGPPAVRYDPQVADVDTGVLGDAVVVSSPASGRDDAWSDGRVLSALGARLAADLGATAPGAIEFEEIVLPAVEAYRRAACWTFAAAVQGERAVRRVDAAGMPLAAIPTLLADLPAAPPPGIPVPAESVLEIETGRVGFDAAPVLPRGQRAAPVLATLLHETCDAPDDDPVAGSAADFLSTWVVSLQAERPVYEIFHDLWVAGFGDPAGAFTERVRSLGGVAIEIDAYEPDEAPGPPPEAAVWDQPPLDPAGGVVVSEIFVGPVDGVELTNTSTAPVDVGGWRLIAARNGFGDGPTRRVVLPAGTRIAAGRSVLVLEGTPESARSPLDVPAPQWSVPWAAGADGAVTLQDASTLPVDFVRWNGARVSSTPVPGALAFDGALESPADERSSLSRDALGTDTDRADDFRARTPTPGWPDAGGLRVHTLRPIGDVDRFVVRTDVPVEIHSRRDRDEGVPLWLAGDEAATTGPGIGNGSAGSVAAVDDTTVVRLRTDGDADTSTGLSVFVWRPVTPIGLFPVDDLRATVAGSGALADTVRVRWSLTAPPDSVFVFENGVKQASLPSGAEGLDLFRPIGRYTYRVETWQAGIAGPSRSTRVFVGPISCDVDEDFQLSFQFDQPSSGFFFDADEPAALDGAVLVDRPVDAAGYPPSDTATAIYPATFAIDVGSRVRLEHAVHLAGDDDRAFLDVSVDDGLQWTPLASWDGTEFDGDAGDADWTDGVLEAVDLIEQTVDLSDFAGERVRLRLRRTSGAQDTSLGWTIDTLVVEPGGLPGVYSVAPDGSDVLGCGTPSLPWATPAPALERAQPGDRIELAAGDYDLDAPDGSPAIALPSGVAMVGAGADAVRLRVPAGAEGVRVDGPELATRVAGLTIEGGAVGVITDGVPLEADSLQVDGAATGIVVRGTRALVRDTVLARGAVALRAETAVVDLERATVADLNIGILSTSGADSVRVVASGFARILDAAVRATQPGTFARLDCIGLHDVTVDFAGLVADVDTPPILGDPLHCDAANGVYTVAEISPWLDVSGCGTIGARAVGCARPVATDVPSLATRDALHRARPNPFNPRTTLAFDLARSTRVALEVFDSRGRRVVTLVDGTRPAGLHRVVWTGTDASGRSVASGVYFVRLRAGAFEQTRRVALVR